MNQYINYLKRNNYSKNTITTYSNIVKKYENMSDIRNIKKEILKYKENPNTAWTHYNVICSYMKWKGDKRLNSLKQLKLPPIPQSYRNVFTKNFLMKKTENMSCKKSVTIRFLFETGMRAEELKNIISINKKTIVLKGKGNKIREIFHNWETTKHFKGFEYTTKTLRIWVKEVLGEIYTPHSIRRSHATHLLLNGANPKTVMMQLGHAKVETTYKYLNLSMNKNLKIYNKYF